MIVLKRGVGGHISEEAGPSRIRIGDKIYLPFRVAVQASILAKTIHEIECNIVTPLKSRHVVPVTARASLTSSSRLTR